MLEIIIAILMAIGSPVSKTTTTVSGDSAKTLTQQDNDTSGEGGHIPPIHP